MTPFGRRLRALRAQNGLTLKAMASEIGVSPAYLSALEHGHRGRPNRRFVQEACRVLNTSREEGDRLARLAELSHPRVTVDTAGLTPEATELANRLAERVHTLSEERIQDLLAELRRDVGEDVSVSV